MPAPFGELVTTAWLAGALGAKDLAVLDATWFLPAEGRDAAAEYRAAHIPGAVYFDIDAIADQNTPLPHMLPDAATFGRAIGALGVGNDTRVVIYDRNAMACAARVWWTLRAFGHDHVTVLDGGFARWLAEGRPIASDVEQPSQRRFAATWQPGLVADLTTVRAKAARGTAQILDARTSGRFHGAEPEPRPGLRGGHVPGAKNLPFKTLLAEDGTLLPVDALRRKFADADIDTAKPVIAMCGSGVTASLIVLALRRVGARDAAVYDGSWAEWGARSDTPVAL